MECLLRITKSQSLKTTQKVLILILMECLLRKTVIKKGEIDGVLILILMECLLSMEKISKEYWIVCLNPYSNGMLT